MYKEIVEGKVKLKVPVEEKISKELPVFYNPVMKLNRDMSILFLKALDREDMQICDPLAGSGVRSIRFLLELPADIVRNITVNDKDPESVKMIRENLALNGLDKMDETELIIENREANALLSESSGYDYIDVDPFGTPNPFLDIASRRISREGILAVTATDTSSLAGTFINACKRKYWAIPRRDYLMHETGLRILIRKCQLVAAQYDKALVPMCSYSKDHYMRVFFICHKGKSKVDMVLKQHGELDSVGPMWLGDLWNKEIIGKMNTLSAEMGDDDFDHEFIQLLDEEADIGGVGFHDVHALCKKLHVECPRFEDIFSELEKAGHKYSRTHFSQYGIRSSISTEDFLELLKKL